ncbi:MAG: ParB/RepB/Spo0J family partition protein [Pseudobdellovibrionaceae bacterium]
MSELTKDNQNKKARLGRGLGSLLGGGSDSLSTPPPQATPAPNLPKMDTQTTQMNIQKEPALPPEARVWQVAIDKLSASEYQPRNHFEKDKLEELAASIKQNGILQPIVARKLPSGRFEIIAGERRWRAAQLAGLHEVPVILKTLENQAALELAIIENIQREDLNPIDEAEAYQRLSSEFSLTQQQVADKVGKDRATVANAMRLLALPKAVKDLVIQKEISTGHAKVLLSLTNPQKQVELAKRISQQKISVRQLEKLVVAEAAGTVAEPSAPNNQDLMKQKLVSTLAEDLQKTLGTKVTIDYRQSKGQVSIHFYSDEELTQIVERLKESHG